ncbi:uncharacterized protein BCR38DRAFT_312850, partial [Pseudomassariella vexata]
NPDKTSQTLQIIQACFLALATWNVIEMIPSVLFTFKRRGGLYFWSIVTSNLGIGLSSIVFFINNFRLSPNILVPSVFGIIGWIMMVTSQSLVLYSRLHMLYFDMRTLRCVLVMIIWNAITLHSIAAVLTIGANSHAAEKFLFAYSVFEKIQVTLFFIQESIISGLYLWKSFSFLGFQEYHERTAAEVKGILQYLIFVNIVVILLDISVLVLEFLGLYLVQVTCKVFAYSVKLKLEVSILNRLVDFVNRTR